MEVSTTIDHVYIMQLIIGYTCVGVFVATAIIMLLAMIGFITLPPDERQRLFVILIVEIVVICLGLFSGLLRLDAASVGTELQAGNEANKALTTIETSTTESGGDTELPPRIYLHISNEGQRALAQAAQATLRAAGGIIVPGIEDVGPSSPSNTEFRYFRESDAPDAQRIADLLKSAGISVEPRLVAGYEDIRPLHFELWFEKVD